jgi:hypothetical protein
MVEIDYENAREYLESRFSEIEQSYAQGDTPTVPTQIVAASGVVFSSNTQAYREVMLGCLLVRVASPGANIRQPYLEQGDKAFSGRTLDEKVVNPFLQGAQIPSSKGPYLSVFRRSVRFDESTRPGLRDKEAYDAFIAILNYIEAQTDTSRIVQLLNYVLYQFLLLREASNIQKLNCRGSA